MESLDNLGYNTYVLGTIRSVTECKKIVLYNKHSFIGVDGYRRLNLYNLEDIYYDVLLHNQDKIYSITRDFNPSDYDDEDAYKTVPFFYDCWNNRINGFNIIIYVDRNDAPVGYTEFINTQGGINGDIYSDTVYIYLNLNVELNEIVLELNNSLYKIKDSINGKDFIGTDINKFPSSSSVKSKIDTMPKDQKYTSHLSAFISASNESNIYLNNRVLLSDDLLIKLDFIRNTNIFDGEEYSNFQIGYYGNDIVLYAWSYISSLGEYFYRIVSLLTQQVYKYTRLNGNELIDGITRYDNEVSKDLLYGAGKYLIFRINNQSTSKLAAFDTVYNSWYRSDEKRILIDQLDITSKVYEFSNSMGYDTATDLFPGLCDTYWLETQRTGGISIEKKIGDWFFIVSGNYYIATCMHYSLKMTRTEYLNSIVINNNTLLIKYDNYYIVYHSVGKDENLKRYIYETEYCRYMMGNGDLIDVEFGSSIIKMCDDNEKSKYLNYYTNSEISIVYKHDNLYNTILDAFRKQPLYDFTVPNNIIGATGGIIFYLDQQNNINYI